MGKIALKNICKRYGKESVIEDLSLLVNDQEFMVFIGPSGCGKTSLLRIIAGLEAHNEGEIFIGEKPMTGVPPQARNIAMVFQNYALYPHLNVYQNISLSLKIRKLQEDHIRSEVLRVAKILNIGHLLEKRPKQLSGGQRQRVAMGRALVRNPEAFLFDEPLSNLDAALRFQLRYELKKLHQELRVTTVYVTHDQVEALSLADRLVVLNAGKIQQIGSPAEIFSQPKNMFVASFMGNPRMNLFQGEENSLKDSLQEQGDGRNFYEHVGIRPEHLFLDGSGGSSPRICGTIDNLEVLGTKMHLYVKDKYQQNITVVHPFDSSIRLGDTVKIAYEREHLHFFSREKGERLTSPAYH